MPDPKRQAKLTMHIDKRQTCKATGLKEGTWRATADSITICRIRLQLLSVEKLPEAPYTQPCLKSCYQAAPAQVASLHAVSLVCLNYSSEVQQLHVKCEI